MRPILDNRNADVGFQIAPMIDVVFVILVFFMALAGQIRIEQILATRLPGTAVADEPVNFVDEQIILVGEDGEVLLNDEPLDPVDSIEMPGLSATLGRLRDNAAAAQTKLVVTIIAAENARYARVVDVLSVLERAGVTNVTFTATPEY